MSDPVLLPEPARPGLALAFLNDPAGCIQQLYHSHGLLASFLKGGSRVVFAFGPEFNRAVHGNPGSFHILSRFPGPRHSAQRRFGQGLFSQNGEEHDAVRRLLMPPFRKESLAGYYLPLIRLIQEWLDDWRAGQTRDLVHESKELTLRFATRLLFGIENLDIAHRIQGLFEEWLDLNHIVSFASQLPVEVPSECYRNLLDVAERLEVELHALVQEKRQRPLPGRDVLSILLEARDAGRMADVDVIAQTITLFNAAYHTTTYALTWCLFLLAQHPKVMSQVHDEQTAIIRGAIPSMEQMGQLSVLDRVIRESLRLLPPVVYTPRVSVCEADLGPFRVPTGTIVLCSPYMSGRLPDVFPDPKRFLPDRWLGGTVSPWAYIPFGAGPRLCLGAPLATLLVKLVVTRISQRCRLQVVPGACIERHGTLTLGARFGVPVQLFDQDRQFSSSPVSGTIHEMVELPQQSRPAAQAA